VESGNSGIKKIKGIVSIDSVALPIFVLDGQKLKASFFDTLSTDVIKSVSVLKGESAKKM